jgi:hypothetical protein
MQTRTTSLALAVLLLTVLAGGILLAENRPQPQRASTREAFQHLVGGLGFGPALDLSSCPFGFDPRLQSSCSFDCGPIPGGSCFCRRHAGAVFPYSTAGQEEGHAPPP